MDFDFDIQFNPIPNHKLARGRAAHFLTFRNSLVITMT